MISIAISGGNINHQSLVRLLLLADNILLRFLGFFFWLAGHSTVPVAPPSVWPSSCFIYYLQNVKRQHLRCTRLGDGRRDARICKCIDRAIRATCCGCTQIEKLNCIRMSPSIEFQSRDVKCSALLTRSDVFSRWISFRITPAHFERKSNALRVWHGMALANCTFCRWVW